MISLTITLPGIPTAKGRPRFARMGKFVRTYTPKATEQAEETIAGHVAKEVARRGIRFDGPVELLVTFYLPRPKGHYNKKRELRKSAPEYPVVKPDVGNLMKLLEDAINKSGAWRDDCQVVHVDALKLYTDALPRTVVTLRELTEAQPQRKEAGRG